MRMLSNTKYSTNFTHQNPLRPLLEKIADCLLLIFFGTLLIVSQRNFYFIIPAIFALSGILFIIYNNFSHLFRIQQDHRIILYTFMAYSIIAAMLALIHQENFSNIKFEMIPLLLSPALLFFCYCLNHSKVLYYIFPLVSITIGFFALYDKYILGAERALETQQPVIPVAGIAITLALFCIAFFFKTCQRNVKYSIFAIIASILGITASILTGSRGAWICFPIVFTSLLIHFRTHIPRPIKMLFIPCLFIILILFLLLTDSGIVTRLEQMKIDLIWYFQDHNPNSSIGLRFEFWKSAIDGFIRKPLLGWGNDQYIHMKELQAQNGLIIPEAIPFVHAHNQFLDVLVKKGFILFLATLAILIIPLSMFYKYQYKNKIIAILGYILIFNVFTFCLSDSFLRLPLGMIFYIMTIYMLLGFLIKYESS